MTARAAPILSRKQQRITPMMKVLFWLLTAAIVGCGIYLIMYMQNVPGA